MRASGARMVAQSTVCPRFSGCPKKASVVVVAYCPRSPSAMISHPKVNCGCPLRYNAMVAQVTYNGCPNKIQWFLIPRYSVVAPEVQWLPKWNVGLGEETTPSRGGARCGLRLLMTVSRATLEPSDLTTPGFCRTKTGFGKSPTQILGRDPRSQFCVQALVN